MASKRRIGWSLLSGPNVIIGAEFCCSVDRQFSIFGRMPAKGRPVLSAAIPCFDKSFRKR